MLRFGIAKPQYVLLLTTRSKCAEKESEKKSGPKLDLNSVPLLVSPVPYPVSCGEVLIGLSMLVWLLLTETKINRNSKTKAKIKNPRHQIFSFYALYMSTKNRKLNTAL